MHIVETDDINVRFHYVPVKRTKLFVNSSTTNDDPVMESCPTGVEAVYITRRRHTNLDDVNRLYDEVMACANDIVDAAKVGGHADKILSLTFLAAENMSQIARRNQKLRNSGYSKARMKWIWAYRRVLSQVVVAQFSARYDLFLEKFTWNNDLKKYEKIKK